MLLPTEFYLTPSVMLPACFCAQALEVVDALIDGMECGGEQASTQLGLVQQPLLAELRAGHGRPCSQAAVSLVGTLCEKRPETASELRDGGAVASVAQHLLHSELAGWLAAQGCACLPCA